MLSILCLWFFVPLLSVHVCSSSWCLRSSFAMSVAKYMTKAPGHVSPTQCAEFLRHKGNQTQWAQLNPPSGKVAANAASFTAQKRLDTDHKTKRLRAMTF